jgi:hypothetical protein
MLRYLILSVNICHINCNCPSVSPCWDNLWTAGPWEPTAVWSLWGQVLVSRHFLSGYHFWVTVRSSNLGDCYGLFQLSNYNKVVNTLNRSGKTYGVFSEVGIEYERVCSSIYISCGATEAEEFSSTKVLSSLRCRWCPGSSAWLKPVPPTKFTSQQGWYANIDLFHSKG